MLCSICHSEIFPADIYTLQSRGLSNFIHKSKSRGEDDWKRWEGKTAITIHTQCRDRYSKLRYTPPRKKPKFLSQNSPVYSTEHNIEDNITTYQSVQEMHKKCFDSICNYIETSGKFEFCIDDIEKNISNNIPREELYKMLRNKYNKNIEVSCKQGRKPIIYYNLGADINPCKKWYLEGNVDVFEKNIILTTAAQILQADARSINNTSYSYPPAQSFLNNLNSGIPTCFLNFFNLLFSNSDTEKNNVKIDMLVHAIISVINPKQFSSTLQLSLGVYILRKTGSKHIVNLLNKLGICASYNSVQLYESSIVLDPPPMKINSESFLQFVFDNTDHNVSTIDGNETFHCLGGIAIYTPDHSVKFESGAKKLKKLPPAKLLASKNKIPIKIFGTFNENILKNFCFQSIKSSNKQIKLSNTYGAYLWLKTFKFHNVSSWKGFMELLSYNLVYETSRIICQPFINLQPSDFTTINTALYFALSECKKINQKTCFITFDQPLYYKARCLVDADENLKNVKVRLGGFHLLMSFFGSIGFTMEGSGLEDLWSLIYATQTAKHLFSGHAFSRTLRAHILTFTAIGIHICEMIDVTEDQKLELQNLFQTLIEGEEKTSNDCYQFGTHHHATILSCATDPTVNQLTYLIQEKISYLEKCGPTSKLWIQYFKLVILCLQFLESERLGNFALHLETIQEMLPLFHSTGHFAYAKCAQIYYQDMKDLEIVMPETEFHLYANEGYFTIRRSNKPWSGVWSDMTIESTLNRYFGTDLKHGRGVTPSVVTRYLSAMPSAFAIMESLEEYCGIYTQSSEQHIDLNKSRLDKDSKDIDTLLTWFNDHQPFLPSNDLKSLSTGVIADKTIDCYMAIEKGLQSMEKMVGKTINKISLSRLLNVKPLSLMKNTAHIINNDTFSCDTNLIFQRLLTTFNIHNEEKTMKAFSYELSPFPQSLFNNDGFIRKSIKSDLYDFFISRKYTKEFLDSLQYVIDGGWLLRKVKWPHSIQYKDLCMNYLKYLHNHYGKDCIVVFDGYSESEVGTKAYERYRRNEKISASVEIQDNLQVIMNQKKFLSNISNKHIFVNYLSTFLSKNGIKSFIAVEDADLLIVNNARKLADTTSKGIAVVGNDVDLMVLLISTIPKFQSDVYFLKMGDKEVNTKLYSAKDNDKLQSSILLCHAFSGTDTTSVLFGKSKKTVFSVFNNNPELIKLCSIFLTPINLYIEENKHHNLNEFEVYQKFILNLYKSAEKLLYKLYDPQAELEYNDINQLRYKIFCRLVVKSKSQVTLEQLPPTKGAFIEHVKRIYLQIQAWLGNTLEPTKWGWKKTKSMLLPIMTNEPPAPDEILKQISCSCKADCKSKLCSCKKAGLPCTEYCKYCNGDSCENPGVTYNSFKIDLEEENLENGNIDPSFISSESENDECI